MSESDYAAVARGSLKLKVEDAGVTKKHKKKKKHKKGKKDKRNKEKEQLVELQAAAASVDVSDAQNEEQVDARTPAEIAHVRRVEARLAEQLLKKAEKSHKERVMDFNAKLDSSSEHFDMPKLSWTK